MRLLLAIGLALFIAAPTARVDFLPYDDVRPILQGLADGLPPELRGSDEARRMAWPGWIADHDRQIRARLAKGDADTIVNWALFGTSFTTRPRVSLERPEPPEQLAALVAGRVNDLVAALRAAGQNERRVFARTFFEAQGFSLLTEEGRARLAEHLLAEVSRVAAESRAYAAELGRARTSGDATADFAARSRVFRDRGLSLDTSLQPSFALDRALRDLKTRGVLAPGGVRRAAIIGPGLDFSDKSAGVDVFAQQTLQPFMLIDSLRRLDLSPQRPTDLVLATLDISPRVNGHLARVRATAARGTSYFLHFPIDPAVPWRPDLLDYWRTAGSTIGNNSRDLRGVTGEPTLQVRTVTVPSGVVLRVMPVDLNIVTQRYEGAPFDLIVATNVLVYYDTLDQSLALKNIEYMLNPGGVLLSNNALLELPASRMRSAGYTTTVYSDRPDDGDHIVWYRRDQ